MAEIFIFYSGLSYDTARDARDGPGLYGCGLVAIGLVPEPEVSDKC